MRRPALLIATLIGAALLLAGCAGQIVSTTFENVGDQLPDPTAASQQADETAAASTDGGASGGAPALADGPWTGGQGAVTVSGGVEWETDEPITTDVSGTTDAKTLLGYNSDDTYVTIMINLTGVPFHASVDAPSFSASSEDCEVTYARADDTGIDATFSCVVDEFHSFTGEEPEGDVLIDGTFTATR
jgi:hypothetical protein